MRLLAGLDDAAHLSADGGGAEVSARIGRVTGLGLAGNLRRHYPRWLLMAMVSLLLVANVINLGADLGAMGAALQLILGGSDHLYVVMFGVGCAGLQIFMDYRRYAAVLKWLTLSLFAYVGVVFFVDVPWDKVVRYAAPRFRAGAEQLTTIVAISGTTISPYLFFWQSQKEVEELRDRGNGQRLSVTPRQAGRKSSVFRSTRMSAWRLGPDRVLRHRDRRRDVACPWCHRYSEFGAGR